MINMDATREKKIVGYVRESTRHQELGAKDQEEKLRAYGCTEIIIDLGQSGEDNITESPNWKYIQDTMKAGDELVVLAHARLGRKSYEVSYSVGKLIERGISIHILDENRTYDNLDEFDQNFMLAFGSAYSHQERVEIKRRTRHALNVLKDGGVTLGAPPRLYQHQIDVIQELHQKGLGYRSISKLVTYINREGIEKHVSPNTIKKVIAGGYMSREEWERENRDARTRIGLGA